MASQDTAASLSSFWEAQPDLPKCDGALVEAAMSEGGRGRARIGEYEVLRVLGKGDFAAVYECRPFGQENGPHFACKTVKKARVERHSSGDLRKAKRNIGRVNNEVKQMRRLAHVGICRLYDTMQSPSYLYIVMEMGERDLFTFLDARPRGATPKCAVEIARQLAEALAHCHASGVAHLDVKPENVLVAGDDGAADFVVGAGATKLCDFGLCHVVEPGVPLTDFVGSPGFFCPEQFTGTEYDGPLADAWSLGSVLVECLLGHQTFDRLWCAPYEDLGRPPEAFEAGIRAAVTHVRARIGAMRHRHRGARRLIEGLLAVDPRERAPIARIVAEAWFDDRDRAASPSVFALRALSPSGSGASLDPARTARSPSPPAIVTPPESARRPAYCETPGPCAARRVLGERFLEPVGGATALAAAAAAAAPKPNRALPAANTDSPKLPKLVA